MAYFRISQENLTRFIRSYHDDMIGTPEWGDGTSTNIPANEFWRVAEEVWGLNGNSGYMQDSHEFDFKIIDSGQFKRVGLVRYGQVYN